MPSTASSAGTTEEIEHLRIVVQNAEHVVITATAYGRYWARSKTGIDRREATADHFVGDLQDLLGDGDDDPRPLSATPFHSIGGQIRDSLGALPVPELGAAARPGRGGPAPTPAAVARLLRDLADLLDGGQE